MRLLVLLALVGCAVDEPGVTVVPWPTDGNPTFGDGAAPSGQVPPPNSPMTIEVSRLIQGYPAQFTVRGAPPGAAVTYGVSLQGAGTGFCPAGWGGAVCLDLNDPPRRMCQAQADPAGNAGCAVPTVPTSPMLSNRQACFQPAVVDGVNSLTGAYVCTTVESRHPLDVTPDPLVLDIQQGRATGLTVSIENLVPMPIPYRISDNCGPLVSMTTGNPVNAHDGVAPAEGQGQFQVDVDATAATLGSHSCSVTVTPDDRTIAPIVVPFDLEVVPPTTTVTLPSNATVPTNLGGQVAVSVIGATGAPQAGFPTTFTIIPGSCDGTFLTVGNPTQYTTVTAANGTAFVSVQPTANCTGSLGVAVTVTNPASGVQIGGGTTTVTWRATQGNIYFWTIGGGIGRILEMPADYQLPNPVQPVDSVPELANGGVCVGCHAASPVPLPTTGLPSLFIATNDFERIGLADEIVNYMLGNPGPYGRYYAVPPDPSVHQDFSPDASKVVYKELANIYVFDVNANTYTPISGADSPTVENMPTFSSDGSHVAFVRTTAPDVDSQHYVTSAESPSLWTVPSAGGAPIQLVPAMPGKAIYYPEYSPDGRWLAFNVSSTDQAGAVPASSYSSSTAEIWLLPVDRAGLPTGPARALPILNTVAGDYGAASWPTWSPDGSWLAFARQVNPVGPADWDIYLTAIDAQGHASPPVEMPRAASPGVGEHLPNWGP